MYGIRQASVKRNAPSSVASSSKVTTPPKPRIVRARDRVIGVARAGPGYQTLPHAAGALRASVATRRPFALWRSMRSAERLEAAQQQVRRVRVDHAAEHADRVAHRRHRARPTAEHGAAEQVVVAAEVLGGAVDHEIGAVARARGG